MVMYPFLIKSKNKVFLRLHKKIYDKTLLACIKKEESDMVRTVLSQKEHYLVELDTNKETGYLDFLNYLIYLKRAK